MTKMLFSATDWSFFPKVSDAGSYYDRLAGIGYDGVEMVNPLRWEKARAAGLQIVNISGPGMTTGLNRRENHTELLPALREVIATAGANGIPQVIIFSGNRQGQSDREGIMNCRIGIEAVLPDAVRHKVTLAFEMLNTTDHPDYQADHGAYGFELVRQIGSPWLKLVYDIYHMERMGDDSSRDIPANLSAIAHVHVAETPRRSRPCPAGNIDYTKIVRAVTKAGYAGFWGMEFIPDGDPLAELAEARDCFLALKSK
jgi:hydroxypyruvate isomerase